MVRQMTDTFSHAKDFESLVYLSMCLLQAEGIRLREWNTGAAT